MERKNSVSQAKSMKARLEAGRDTISESNESVLRELLQVVEEQKVLEKMLRYCGVSEGSICELGLLCDELEISLKAATAAKSGKQQMQAVHERFDSFVNCFRQITERSIYARGAAEQFQPGNECVTALEVDAARGKLNYTFKGVAYPASVEPGLITMKLLEYAAQRIGDCSTDTEVLNGVWKGKEVEPHVITATLCNLRKLFMKLKGPYPTLCKKLKKKERTFSLIAIDGD